MPLTAYQYVSNMSVEYIAPFVLGVFFFVFAKDICFGRRFGPIMDVSHSRETGGIAFRSIGLLFNSIAIIKFL